MWVGSFNLDPRSANLNTEVGLIIRDVAVAQAIEENILRDMAPQNSWTVGRRKRIPVLSRLRSFVGTIADLMPIVDLWPFRETALFKIRDGMEPVPFHHAAFHERYISVGTFPQVGWWTRVRIRLIKAFGGLLRPVI